VRRRLRALLPRLHLFPALSEKLDQWAEWLIRTRFEGKTEQEVRELLGELATFRDTVLANARVHPGDVVADVGAGTGLLTVAAAERVVPDGEVFALDVSVDALEELRRATEAANIFYMIGSADVLPLPDAFVDVVVTRSVLIYVDDKAGAAAEFFRVLRSGGRVSVFEPINRRNTRLSEVVDFGDLHRQVTEWEQAIYEDAADPMLNFDEGDLERFFVDAGFTGVSLDLRAGEGEMPAERQLRSVGAPGRRSLLESWERTFTPDVVERLTAAVRQAGAIRRGWPQLYLHAVKR
jgi:SAM-dependent methyltransferase